MNLKLNRAFRPVELLSLTLTVGLLAGCSSEDSLDLPEPKPAPAAVSFDTTAALAAAAPEMAAPPGTMPASETVTQVAPTNAQAASGASDVAFTGHSLGAAQATIAAQRWHDQGGTVASVTTFGSPRVGSPEWVSTYDAALGEKTVAVVNQDDLVPHLPFELMVVETPGDWAGGDDALIWGGGAQTGGTFAYDHVAEDNRVILNGDGTYTVAEGLRSGVPDIDLAEGAWLGTQHQIGAYLEGIQANPEAESAWHS